MLNKIALSIVLLIMPLPALADNGKFTYVEPGMEVPFRGTLFDNDATAHLLTLPEYYELQCDLDMEYQLGMLTEKYNFEVKDLQAQLEFAEKEKVTIIEQKDSRIELLEVELKKKNKNDKPWIFGTGVTIGIGLTIGIIKSLEAINEN
jgi:hypothetical protein